jgi:hypothetical protein
VQAGCQYLFSRFGPSKLNKHSTLGGVFMRNQIGLGIVGSAALGGGLMFLLDPDLGRRRRAILRDKLISLGRLTAFAADKTSRDVQNRIHGVLQSTKSRFDDTPVIDDVVVDRVRARMGRTVSHPHAIQVRAENGRVILSGEILSEELDDLIRSVSSVKGVLEVDNQLTAHDEPGDISSLQGGHSRHGSRLALLQTHWAPAVRLIVGGSGLAAAGAGIKQGGILGSILGAIGTGMVVLAITNRSMKEMVDRASKVAEERRTIPFPAGRRRTG